MLLEYNKTVAYICPNCAGVNTEKLDIFSFSGNKSVILKCIDSCGENCATIIPKKDKYKINIDCPICGDDHSFFITKSKFWNNNYQSFKCPASGIDIYFWGNQSKVIEALNKYEVIFSEMSEAIEDEELLTDMLEYIKGLFEMGNVYCSCGSHDILFDIVDDGVELLCDECGASKTISIGEDYLMILMNTDGIILEKK